MARSMEGWMLTDPLQPEQLEAISAGGIKRTGMEEEKGSFGSEEK